MNPIKQIINKLKEVYNQISDIDLDVDNFVFKDWNVYYNLFNPENFEDPDNAPDWYVVEDVYEYYEIPFVNANLINIYCNTKINNFKVLEEFILKSNEIENLILEAIVHYTFGGGGAYAAPEHYEYAKKTIEIRHKTKFSNQEFIKRNLRIKIIHIENDNMLRLHFDCSWDEEHGLVITLKNNSVIGFE